MMNEKQIYNRMNKCYESEYGHYDGEAEWYGSDHPKEWKFYIPSKKITVLMLMEEKTRRIYLNEKKDDEDEYRRVGIYDF